MSIITAHNATIVECKKEKKRSIVFVTINRLLNFLIVTALIRRFGSVVVTSSPASFTFLTPEIFCGWLPHLFLWLFSAVIPPFLQRFFTSFSTKTKM